MGHLELPTLLQTQPNQSHIKLQHDFLTLILNASTNEGKHTICFLYQGNRNLFTLEYVCQLIPPELD